MNKLKLKIGDKVKVMLGKDKGRDGTIEKTFAKTRRVLVSGINIYKKHVKTVGDQKGGIFEISRPLDVSKIMLVCPKCKKETRVGVNVIDGKKVRICKKCGREVDTGKAKK